MKIQLQRILHDKEKVILAILLLLFPAIEALQILYQTCVYEDSAPHPLYATFLSCYTRGHILHKLYFWFLPLYFLILVGDECIEDHATGYKNVMIAKMGKKKYIKTKLLSSFSFSFFIVVCGLLLNLTVVCIAFRNGKFIKLGEENAKPGICLRNDRFSYNQFVVCRIICFKIYKERYLLSEGETKIMIQLQNVSKKLKSNQVLNNISYAFEEGKVYGLYGRNGSGKTMLLRAVSGLIQIDSGTASAVFGKAESQNTCKNQKCGR